jgi:purine nucleosidase
MFVARSVVTMLHVPELPVTCGRESPIGKAEPFPADWRAGADKGNGISLPSPAFAPDPRPAPDLIVDLASAESAAGRKLAILTLGTLTNLALALELDPTLPPKVRVVSMLGAVGVPGNVMTQGVTDPTAEWNAHADPAAVARVLDAGFDLTLVPLDATNEVPLTAELFATLEADHAAGPADLAYEIWARNPFMYSGGFYLWDPLAAAALRDPSIVTTRRATLRVVEGAAADGGRLLEDPAGGSVEIATTADKEAFEAFLLAHLRIGGPRSSAFTPTASLAVIAGAGRCEARFEPTAPAAGLISVTLTVEDLDHAAAIVFDPGEVPWSTIEAFAAAPPDLAGGASPPPVVTIAYLEARAPETGAGFAEAAAGGLGIACVTGPGTDPSIVLAGPFEIDP